ncbi:hypothetical protein ID144_18290 [Pseudomonas sp. JM0905a]|uniref:hypothetical protein n=1 Tax=Pseudomonas sp. JM0905a TaxID=2772484 RepID=UPI001686099B|nr:hypothetical protein [Pseudomonas sp. JM0905a]MBD2838990.1 hypothetical protein [Pseudomonas sp. JM0905a]
MNLLRVICLFLLFIAAFATSAALLLLTIVLLRFPLLFCAVLLSCVIFTQVLKRLGKELTFTSISR